MRDAGAQRRQQLLLQPADRQHAAAQRDLARHRHVAPHRDAGEDGDDAGRHGDARARPILRRRALRHMHMDVAPLEQRRLEAEAGRPRPDIGHCRRDALLHDVAELAGGLHLALARHGDGLDRQDFAAHLGPGEAGDDAHHVLGLGLAVAELPHARKLLEILRGDGDLLRLLRDDLLHRLAGEPAHLALEVPHAGLARVVAHQVAQRLLGDGPLARLQPIRLGLLRQQVAPCDLDLLILGVAGDADDLHAVHQRLRHAQAVGGRHEHHIRQVVIDLEIVVGEGAVLLRIQHFEQRRGRIAAPVGTELVDLVEQEERVRGLRLLHALDDLARHGADIGPPVAAHLRLVPHAAKRHAHEGAAGGLGDRLAERGLADAGRADQAEDRTADLRRARLHRQVLDNPLLDLLEPVVVGIEHLLGSHDVAPHPGLLLPGDGEHPVEVVAHHRGLGAHRRHGAELLQLRQRLLARFLAEGGRLDAGLELRNLVLAVLALAQLLLDRLELLVQVVLALRLLHLPLHAVADALLDLQHADLGFHMAEDALQPRGGAGGLEQLLLLRDLQREMAGNGVGELRRVVDLVDRNQDLGRDLLVELDVLLELPDHGTGQRLGLRRLGRGLGERRRIGLEMGLGFLEAGDLRALAALDQHLHRAIRQLQQLQHRGDGADRIQILGLGIVLRGILLRDEEDLLVLPHHRFQRADGFLAADEERHDHMREHHDVPQGQDRQQFAAQQLWGFIRHYGPH